MIKQLCILYCHLLYWNSNLGPVFPVKACRSFSQGTLLNICRQYQRGLFQIIVRSKTSQYHRMRCCFMNPKYFIYLNFVLQTIDFVHQRCWCRLKISCQFIIFLSQGVHLRNIFSIVVFQQCQFFLQKLVLTSQAFTLFVVARNFLFKNGQRHGIIGLSFLMKEIYSRSCNTLKILLMWNEVIKTRKNNKSTASEMWC